MPNWLARHRPVFLLVALAAVSAGCGVAEYEKRLEKTVAALRKSAVFDVLYQPTELPGTPILVRVPMKFTQRLVEGAELEGKKIEARRAKVPLLDLPGRLVTYEATVQDSSGGVLPYYIYLTASPAAAVESLRSGSQRKFDGSKPVDTLLPGELPRMDVSGELFQRVEKAFPSANAAWQDVTCPTPNGTTVSWQRLVVGGEQEFHYVDSAGRERYVKLPGRLEIWARYYGDYQVLVAWRLPESLRAASQIEAVAPLVAGSVTGDRGQGTGNRE